MTGIEVYFVAAAIGTATKGARRVRPAKRHHPKRRPQPHAGMPVRLKDGTTVYLPQR